MAAGGLIRRYWDSSCFITLLNDEEGAEDCERILDDAKEGKTLLCVSPMTQVEVIRPRGSAHPLPKDAKEEIQAFFENDYVKWHIIDRTIASKSQDLCWEYQLHPRDAIHVAVALRLECDLLESFDPHMLRCHGKIKGSSMAIQKPKWVGQPDMFEKD